MELKVINIKENKANELFASVDCQKIISIYEDYYQKIGYNLPWVGYFVLRENQIVGCCGFTGQPKDGKVEIAYYTFKEFEGQGIASFSCKELISIANQTDPTVIITAKTVPEYNASTKILQNFRFTFSEIVQDEEIGDAWLWILDTGKTVSFDQC
jgi:RimJ/RimL family protein N-acetyltransferase